MKDTMKLSTAIAFFAVLIMTGCAATKTTTSRYVGDWNYTVRNLPDGDISGTMMLSHNGEKFDGKIVSEDGSISIDMQDLKIEDENLSSFFYVQGMKVYMNGQFNKDEFSGTVSVDYNDFPMTAHKVE